MKISFLLPTRGRSEHLKLVLDSLANTCNSISNYEVILCFDDDDVNHIKTFDSWIKNYNFKKIVMNRCGYDNIHVYEQCVEFCSQGNPTLIMRHSGQV